MIVTELSDFLGRDAPHLVDHWRIQDIFNDAHAVTKKCIPFYTPILEVTHVACTLFVASCGLSLLKLFQLRAGRQPIDDSQVLDRKGTRVCRLDDCSPQRQTVP